MVDLTGHLGPVRFAGRYVILERLAVGGMGEVFLARQEGIGGFSRTVVLKTLLPDAELDTEAVDRFLDEARVAASLSHENVVTVIEASEHNNSPFLALEYVHGTNASTLRIRARKFQIPVPVVVAARVVADAARGLAHAHRATDADGRPLHIIHRDVSPKNIFVRTDGTSKIGDFGIARSDHRLAKTNTGLVPGTLPYMSPEQARGDPLTPASDQFSLGIVLWEFLMGERLFKGDSATETVTRVMTYHAPAPSTLRADAQVLDHVVSRMLDHDPTKRYPSLDDVAAAIEECVPEARLDIGAKAVSLLVETVCGSELMERKARIESGVDATVRVRHGNSSSEASAPSLADAAPTAQTARHHDGADAALTRQDRRDGRDPAPPQALTRRPRTRLVAAAAGMTVLLAGIATAWTLMPHEPTPEERTRAYLDTARRRNPFTHREQFLARAELRGTDMSKAEAIAGPLADLLKQRLDILVKHWSLPADARSAQARSLADAEMDLVRRARALLAPLGDDAAAEALASWVFESGAPGFWQPPPTPANVQETLKMGALEYRQSQADLLRLTLQRLCRRSCRSPEQTFEQTMQLVREHNAILRRWAGAPPDELDTLDAQADVIELRGSKALKSACDDDLGADIASFVFLRDGLDPENWVHYLPAPDELLRNAPPPTEAQP